MSDAPDALAGRELDVLIAERIFGLTVKRNDYGTPFVWREIGPGGLCHVPVYSVDIRAAWEVVEHFQAAGAFVHVAWFASLSEWRAAFNQPSDRSYSTADTAPLAICRAALLARGVTV